MSDEEYELLLKRLKEAAKKPAEEKTVVAVTA